MLTEWQPRIPIADLEDFCLQIGIGKLARLFLRPGLTPRQFFGRLLVHEEHGDALRFQAHVLTKREAVWWAILCLRSVCDPTGSPKQAAALKTAIRWVFDPSEKNRQAAGAAGTAATFNTASGCIAMSAFWSGGSVLPPNEKVTPPDPLLTANTVSGALTVAAAEGPLLQFKETLKHYLALGISITKGQHLWAPPEENKERPSASTRMR